MFIFQVFFSVSYIIHVHRIFGILVMHTSAPSCCFLSTDPDGPLCMRFWIHMYGNGIGSLRVLIYDVNTAQDTVIWKISGEAGNAWYQGQVPISSSSPFKVSPESFELPTFKVQSRGSNPSRRCIFEHQHPHFGKCGKKTLLCTKVTKCLSKFVHNLRILPNQRTIMSKLVCILSHTYN